MLDFKYSYPGATLNTLYYNLCVLAEIPDYQIYVRYNRHCVYLTEWAYLSKNRPEIKYE